MYVDILILTELAARPFHGYELKRHVEQILGNTFTINANQLYPALRRFEEMGAVSREIERQSGKPDRHIYHITPQGMEVLQTMLQDFPVTLAQNGSEFQTRVAFFHLLDPQACLIILATRETVLHQSLQHLEQARLKVSEEHAQFFYISHLWTLQQQQIQQELAWIDALRQEIRP